MASIEVARDSGERPYLKQGFTVIRVEFNVVIRFLYLNHLDYLAFVFNHGLLHESKIVDVDYLLVAKVLLAELVSKGRENHLEDVSLTGISRG